MILFLTVAVAFCVLGICYTSIYLLNREVDKSGR
jgi:hypothetical protein